MRYINRCLPLPLPVSVTFFVIFLVYDLVTCGSLLDTCQFLTTNTLYIFVINQPTDLTKA